MKRSSMAAVTALGLAVAAGAPMARGGPLDPNAFTSLGTLNITGGSYTFDTTTDQLINSGGYVLFAGVTYNGIAVFDFSGITISRGTFNANTSGGPPITPALALLSQGDISFTGGGINVDGTPGGMHSENGVGGPGGFPAQSGPGAGGNPSGGGSVYGGGGFGGVGGSGSSGGSGGMTYGDLATQLIGGSGGGGGGGGRAIELGATGSIAATGGGGSDGGGGSGGGIFLHADSVSLAGSSVLDVSGGGGSFYSSNNGGGGGRILIMAGTYTTSGAGTINLAGGAGGRP